MSEPAVCAAEEQNDYSLCENCAVTLGEDDQVKDSNGGCRACCGILDHYLQPHFISRILQCVTDFNCDVPAFSLSLRMPEVVFLAYFLHQNLHQSHKFSIDTKFCPVKEVYKDLLCEKLKEVSPDIVDHTSVATINIEFSVDAPNLFTECFSHGTMAKKNGRKRTFEERTRNKAGVISRNDFVQMVNSCIDCSKSYSPSLKCFSLAKASVYITVESVFIGGRYLKYSRTLSQTPWFIDGKRKGDFSVEELISNPMKKLAGSDESFFRSSGREDIDARMLGSGRPFAIELVNPSKTKYTEEELSELAREISSSKKVEVRHLHLVEKSLLSHLKDGEMEKKKKYCAILFSEEPFSEDDLAKLTVDEEFSIQQKTPIRVLHRRPLSTRPKVIYNMRCERLDERHLALYLCTEAGAYVKEFVHGDLGRTRPSVCSLLGRVVDIVQLDVADVLLQWPVQA